MNTEHLKKDIGYRVQLIPPALHFDAAGNSRPTRDEDWLIEDVTAKQARLSAASGHVVLLGLDHIQSFYTNPNRTDAGLDYGFLTLHVQVIIEGDRVRVQPNLRPGQQLDPHDSAERRAEAALATFAPELARVLAKQIQALDRIVVNFG